MERRDNDVMKNLFKVPAIIISVSLIGYFLEVISRISYIAGDYFDIFTEFLPVGLSFSIFFVTWYAYRRSRDNHSLFLGAVFLIQGLFYLFHMLSYPFMPEFITPNTYQKAAVFSNVAVLLSSVLFLASGYIHKNSHPKLVNKKVLFISVNTLSFILLITVLIYSEKIPLMIRDEGEPTSYMIFIQIISANIIFYSCYLYKVKYSEKADGYITELIYGFIIIMSGNIIYIFFDLTGHLMKAAGIYVVYLALYRSSIEEPYEEETRIQAQLRLEAEERYRNLIDNSHDGIITTDSDEKVTYWNGATEILLGWKMQEVVGRQLFHLIMPLDTHAEKEQLFRKALQGGSVDCFETLLQRHDGTGVEVSLTFSPLYSANHKITGMSCIVRDITDRKRTEEIRIQNLELELSSKAKSEFLTTMSHDLGTPLNAILGFSVLLKQKMAGELNQKQETYVDNVITSGYRLLDIFNDVLDYGRAETGKICLEIEKVPVNDIINETISLMKEKIEHHNIILKKELDPELEFIEADRQRFKQILFNLISNAVKYSRKGERTITITTKKEENKALVSVTDTGVGIREEDMGKLFKTFNQLDLGISSKYGSTGLGLVVTKKLVELHSGTITVKSRYGKGSTFIVSLPISA